MKKIFSLIICLCIILSLAACVGAPEAITVDTSLKKGKISAVGDVFKLPDIKQESGAPILAQLTKQVYPGDSVMISGEGFLSPDLKVYVYSQTKKNNGRAVETEFTVVDDNYISVLIDKDIPYGIYGIYAETSKGTSALKLVNKPEIWDIGFNKVTAGEVLTVLGENLTTDNKNKTNAFLVSQNGEEYCHAEVSFADSGKVEIIIPKGLKDGEKYKVKIHNGHGGTEGFAESEKYITYSDTPAVSFDGNIIDVTDFGADRKSRINDDTDAVRKAIDSAEDGDTVYFPAGAYLITSQIDITKSVKLLGENSEETIIYSGYNVRNSTFKITADPCEITGICFEQKRTDGPCESSFIDFSADVFDTGCYKIYIHDNKFYQSVTKKSRSYKLPIMVKTYGARIENNYFEAFGLVGATGSKKVFVKNNKAQINLYVGVYYGSSCVLLTGVEFFDVSFNEISGNGANGKENNQLNVNDYTAGRVFVIQGSGKNIYLSHNKVLKSGIPNYNAGEIILFENLYFQYDGGVVSATENTVTVAKGLKNEVTAGAVVSVNNGKGRGQYRKVLQRIGDVITLTEPWDIIPDSTSHITVNKAYLNANVCDNSLDGYKNWPAEPGSTMGLQIYGSTHNLFFCRNRMVNMSFGICVTPYYHLEENNDNARAVIAWNQIDDNYFENMPIGIFFTHTTVNKTGPIPCEMCFGNTVRGNTYKNIKDYTKPDKVGSGGIALHIGPTAKSYGGTWKGNWIVSNLFENNTFKKCAKANMIFCDRQANAVIRNNTEDKKISDFEVMDGCNPPIVSTY